MRYFLLFISFSLAFNGEGMILATPPPPPRNLDAPTDVQLMVAENWNIQITWTVNSSGQSGFNIERRTENTRYRQIGAVGKEINSFLDNTLKSIDSIYYYRIAVCNGSVIGNYSNEIAINLFAPPSNLTLISISDNAVNLSWTDNSDEELGFIISRSINDTLYTTLDTLPANSTNFSDVHVLRGETDYYYIVKAFEKKFQSAQAKLKVTTGFVAPSNLSVSFNSDEKIDYNWTDNTTSETMFFLERSENKKTFGIIDTAEANTTSSYFTGSTGVNKNFYYRIKAISTTRISKYSNIDSVYIKFTAPSNLAITNILETGIKLSWVDNTSFEKYFKLERRNGLTGQFTIVNDKISANSISYDDNFDVKTNSKYYYRISAISSKGNISPVSNTDSSFIEFKAPTDLKIIQTTENDFTLQWKDNSSRETGYKIYAQNIVTGKLDSVRTGVDQTLYTVTEFDKSNSYKITVVAVTQTNQSATSNPVYVGGMYSGNTVTDYESNSGYISADISSDGNLTVLGSRLGAILLKAGSTTKSFYLENQPAVNTIKFSSDGLKFAAGCSNGYLYIFNIDSDSASVKKDLGVTATSLDWSSGGEYIVTGHADNSVYLRSPQSGNSLRKFDGHSSSITSVRFSSNDSRIVSSDIGGSIFVWDKNSVTAISSISSAHSNGVKSVDFLNPSSTFITSTGGDGQIKVWKVADGSKKATFGGHTGYGSRILGRDYSSILSGGEDGRVKIWNAITGKLLGEINVSASPILSIASSKIENGNNKIIFLTKDVIITSTITSGWTEFTPFQ